MAESLPLREASVQLQTHVKGWQAGTIHQRSFGCSGQPHRFGLGVCVEPPMGRGRSAYFFFSCSVLDGEELFEVGAVAGCGGGLTMTVGRTATGAAGCG